MKNVTALAILIALQACQPSDLTAASADSSSDPFQDLMDAEIRTDKVEICFKDLASYPGLECSEAYIESKNGFQTGAYCTTGSAIEDLTAQEEIRRSIRKQLGVYIQRTGIGGESRSDRVIANAGTRGFPTPYGQEPSEAFTAAKTVPGYRQPEKEQVDGIWLTISDPLVTLKGICQ